MRYVVLKAGARRGGGDNFARRLAAYGDRKSVV